MTDTVIVGLCVGVPALLQAAGNIYDKYRRQRRLDEERADERAEALEARQTANHKLDHITELTNSTLDAAKKALAKAEQQNYELQAVNEQLATKLRLVEEMLRKALLRTAPAEDCG